MKKFIYGILGVLGIVVLSVVSSLGVNYYERHYVSEKDTINIEESIANVMDPVLYNPVDVYNLQQELSDEYTVDSVFLSIPPNVLLNIAKVAIGRNVGTTKKEIVEEFRRHYADIYQFINEQPEDTIFEQIVKDSESETNRIRNDTESNDSMNANNKEEAHE